MPQVPPLHMRREWDLLGKTAYTTCEAIKTTHRKGFVCVCKSTGNYLVKGETTAIRDGRAPQGCRPETRSQGGAGFELGSE